MGKLTDRQLQAWVRAGKPIAGKADGGGLTFTLSAAGTASWVLRYRIAGKAREVTLGRYPALSLKEARSLAGEKRTEIEKGKDVAQEKQRAKRLRAIGGTFRDLAEDYMDRVGPSLADSTRAETRRYLDKDLLPRLGSALASDITPADIVGVVEDIAERSPTVARRAFEILSVIFNHGVAKHLLTANPCAGLKPSAIIGQTKPRRQRVKLNRDELRAVLKALPSLGRDNEMAIKVLLATCVRKSELLRARWEHVDLEQGLWTIPDAHSKSGRGFVIPLPDQVVEWFRELHKLAAGSDYVLPGRAVRYGKRRDHLSRTALNAALRRLDVGARDFAPHDLRSTARSYLAELGVDVIVAERCLNHAIGGLVGVYDQHDYLEERRHALGLWAAYIEAADKPDKVTILPKRAEYEQPGLG